MLKQDDSNIKIRTKSKRDQNKIRARSKRIRSLLNLLKQIKNMHFDLRYGLEEHELTGERNY